MIAPRTMAHSGETKSEQSLARKASLSPRAPFVGRLTELEAMCSAIAALPSQAGALFLVSGEPGIGKTRLADELVTAAGESQVRVLWGRCHEIEGRPPYWPWAQVVQSCARGFAPAELAALLAPDAMLLADLIPELRPHLPAIDPAPATIDPEAARFRLFQAVTYLLRQVASAQPVLLILDDLHWADLASLRMLEFLAHELTDIPIVVVATFREVEVRRLPAVADIIDRLSRRGHRLPLVGFTEEEVRRFIVSSAGQPVPPALAQRLRRETEGNPFFLDEIVRQFRDAGWWVASSSGLPVSEGVRSAIRQRLAPLPDTTRRLLAAAAVAGREFDLPLLEMALATPRLLLLDQLAPAIEIAIVGSLSERAGRYRFSHALIRETIYEQLAASERISLHRTFGHIIEDRYEAAIDNYLPELAHHYFAAAAAGEETKALDYAERAGRQALRMLAYEEAAEQFQRALSLLDTAPGGSAQRSGELLLALAEAKNRAGLAAESMQACHGAVAIARRIGSSALLARAAISLCNVGLALAEIGRSDDTLVHILQEALQQLAPDESMLRARVTARIALELFWTRPFSEIEMLSRQALALARRAGDTHTLAYTVITRIHGISDPDSFATRRALIDEVIELTGGRGDLAVNAYLWRFADELQFGDRSSARASGEKLIRAVEELRQPRDMWLIPAVRSREALLLGNFAEAEGYAEQVVEHGTGQANAEQTYLSLLFVIRREQGRHGELVGGLEAIARESVVTIWRVTLSMLYAENGDRDKALALMEGLTRDGLRAIRRDLIWLFSIASLAAACHACAGRKHAAVLYDALLPYAGHTVTTGVFSYFGPVSYYLGLLATTRGKYTDAARHLDDALVAARAFGATPFVARILLAQAQNLEAAGGSGTADAPGLRRQAAELADSMGMAGVAVLARQAVDIVPDAPAAATLHASLRCDGSYWLVTYKGRTSRLKAIKGLVYLARLLGAPHREVHVLDMAQTAMSTARAATLADDGALGVFDARAKKEIGARLSDLRATLAEAEDNNDHYRASQLRSEIDALGEHIASTVGLGGRASAGAANSERARAAVTKALRTAIERIEQCDPALAEVLARSVRTGLFCSYVPLAEMAITWDVSHEPPADGA